VDVALDRGADERARSTAASKSATSNQRSTPFLSGISGEASGP
jgi:hypothetical protein